MQGEAITRLGGVELGRALRAGIQRLFQAREHLDRINVFPVPDGDTGTNLALTMGSVLGALKRETAADAGPLLAGVADAAIDGARGNSGAILAQFFLGVGDGTVGLKDLGAVEVAAAMGSGAAYAREALSMPREGTILTVIEAVAAEFRAASAAGILDLRALFQRACARGRAALAATPAQLDELARAGVVDAGAAGFVALLEGATAYLETGVLDESAVVDAPSEEHDAAGGEASLEHRWCTECMVTGAGIDRRQLRERLAVIGSSLVVAGSGSKVRVHVHTNEPQRVFRIAAGFGAVSAEKADDMQRQQEAALHATRRQVAIVTDSAADIPEDELERLDIHVVPARVHFGAESYLDKVGITPEQFYHLLATSPVHPKTSQPPVGDFRRVFEFLSSHYPSVVSVNASGRVSGTRQAAETAAGRVAAHARIRVIDSGNAAGGEGLLAMHAAELALAGADTQAIAASVAAAGAKTRTFALVGSLDYGVRGGRVPAWARTVANLLHLAPYLTNYPDGRIGIGGFLVGRTGLVSKFARRLGRQLDPARRYRLIVSHGNAPEAGRALLAALTAAHPSIERSSACTAGRVPSWPGSRTHRPVPVPGAPAPERRPLSWDPPADMIGVRTAAGAAAPRPRRPA